MQKFSRRLVEWQKQHGRHDLPWQNTRDPYRIWLSEIMLQQTQVGTVIPYYFRFLERFPDIASLADADEDAILQYWSGLGYYSRARNLHRAAQTIVEQHQGVFPRDFEQIVALPGIGRSTAAAISAFAFGMRCAILDGNVKRVLARYLGVEGYPGDKKVEHALWLRAETLLPPADIEVYTQAVMDFGASVCTRSRPGCPACPLQQECVAYRDQRVSELPTRKTKKALPVRQTRMMILFHNGEVFLEKRPSRGIWGGLWSFPEVTPEQDVGCASLERFGISAHAIEALASLDHTFTHFRLQITPSLLRVHKTPKQTSHGNGIWLSVEEAMGAAIPAPVRKLLQQVDDVTG